MLYLRCPGPALGTLLLPALAVTASLPAEGAAPLRATGGLTAEANGTALSSVSLDGQALPGVSITAVVEDPATGQPAGDRFTVSGRWRATGQTLRLEGEVRASGSEECAADLVIRVEGATLALGTMAEEPLLLPQKLLGKLPLVSLRINGEDSLALAVPPDRLAMFSFRQVGNAVELRFPFGFTTNAKPALRMRAPFTCVIYRTDPRWHFRSALARYYALFPALFKPFARDQGGWFFAAPVAELPNPQHFAYYEGGPGDWQLAKARGMGTYPYRESSSATIHLPGKTLPKSYAEAMEQFTALEQRRTLEAWDAQEAFEIDTTVKRSGAQSLLADPGTTGRWVGAIQSVDFKKPYTGPIRVEGYSRAEGVSGERDNNYSIYVDVIYDDNTYLFGQCATFSPGTHDWEHSEVVIQPEKPVARLRIFCLLRGRSGKAWFDDLRAGPADQPEVNWMVNPGFEKLGRRRDLQYIRDNVCWNSRDEWVFYITDNLSADVGPAEPMNLLRFTLNVDPDIPSTPERPATAATEFAHYDGVFRNQPEVDGLYIDSVSAWCYGVLNFRRDHWRYNDYPFTYEPGSYKVAPHGRFAMFEYLQALQRRYHPKGKPIFTNIHVNLDAFPLYLVSDVPGIESSLFQDQDSLFFYRASSYQKPLLLLNFMNLHGLDRREIAELYHYNAAFWGEFPSTGRFVQRAYREYGDVTHAYVPAIQEISAAGWQPIPLVSGARAERFGEKDAVYFTIQAPAEAAEETLLIQPEALAGMGTTLAAFDAVRLQELPLTRRGAQWALPLVHGGPEVQVVRIMPRAKVAAWLLERARRHALNATRVQGTEGVTAELQALRESLEKQAAEETERYPFAEWHARLAAALASVPENEEDLYALSRRREVLQARQALAALAAHVAGVRFTLEGPRLGYPGRVLALTAQATAPAGVQARVLHFGAQPAPASPLQLTPPAPANADTTLRLEAEAPGTYEVTAWFEVTPAGQPAWQVPITTRAFFVPAAALSLSETQGSEEARSYQVQIERRAPEIPLVLHAEAQPPVEVTPATLPLAADQTQAEVRVRRRDDGLPHTLTVRVTSPQGAELARAETSYWNEPPVPEANLALGRKGARCSVDSTYDGYHTDVLTNGVTATAGLHWTQHAWASKESADSHWVQIDFPEPTQVSEVWLYWAVDNGVLHTSRRYSIIGLGEAGRQELAQIDGQSPRSFSRHTFTPTRVTAIRIEQTANGGSEARPGLLWLREVCVLP